MYTRSDGRFDFSEAVPRDACPVHLEIRAVGFVDSEATLNCNTELQSFTVDMEAAPDTSAS